MAGNKSVVWAVKGWVVNLAGQSIDGMRGDAGGEFLKLEQAEDDFGYKGSGSGGGTFYEMGDKYTIATIILPQASPENQKLMGIHEASVNAGGLPAPFFAKDANGTSKCVTDAALILKTPDETVAQEPGTLEWRIGLHDPSRFVGGH